MGSTELKANGEHGRESLGWVLTDFPSPVLIMTGTGQNFSARAQLGAANTNA